MKKSIQQKSKNFNATKSRFINISNVHKTPLFYDGNAFINLKHKKSNVFYKILVKKKATRHYMEKVWTRKFTAHFDVADWRNIYNRKIKSIPCAKLGEFNYKLIHNLIYPGYILNKWKPSVSSHCSFCSELETLEHLLFLCGRVQNIWKKVGTAFKVDLRWHHLIVGFDETHADIINKTRNLIITIVMFAIFASWVKSGDSKENYKYINLCFSVKIYLGHYLNIFSLFSHKKRMV